ncbi:MAG: hypothetical protein CME02_07590 [Geminicoccus sp.]|nr:hypothetical protein [Geminicoccus sp.]
MKIAIPSLLGLCLLVCACDQSRLQTALQNRNNSSFSNMEPDTTIEVSPDFSAIDRARPADMDPLAFQMIVEVSGDAFPHALFKSTVHAQEAGYCISSGFGDVVKVIDATDPTTGQRFYFLECSETDPSAASAVAEGATVNTAGNEAGAGASAEAMIEGLAQGAALGTEAENRAPEYFDPYANCPVGQGGYPIVTEDCVSRY